MDAIRTRVLVTSSGDVWLNDLYEVDTYIPANGRDVLQYTSPLYRALGGGRIGLTVEFVARITDDRGNALTATNQVTATGHRGAGGEIPE